MLPLVMMGITGAVLVYAHDLEHLLGQGEPPAVTAGEWRTPSELIEAAQAANERSRAAFRSPCAGRSRSGEPAAVRLSRPGMATERPAPRGGQQNAPQARQRCTRPGAWRACRPKVPSPAACRS